MATAEELLRLTPKDENVDKTFHIDMDTRTIKIPPSVKQLGVESDDDVKVITFSMPRYYYDTDLSDFDIYINYLNAEKEGDLFEVDLVQEEDDNLIFNWIVGRHAVASKGKVIFNVCLKKITRDAEGNALRDEEGNVIVEKEFNTTIAELPVLEGLETGEEIAEQYADILMQWEEALFGAGNSVQKQIILKGSEVIKTFEDEAIEQQRQIVLKGSEVIHTIEDFSIEQQRQIVLKGSEVINTVDQVIQGAVGSYMDAHPDQFKGDKGDAFTYDDFTEEQLAELEGDPGYTPQKGVDYFDGISPAVEVSKAGKVTTVTITDATGPHTFNINDGADGSGSGDMSMATFDADGDGVIDDANNAAKLGGKDASEYMLKTDSPQLPDNLATKEYVNQAVTDAINATKEYVNQAVTDAINAIVNAEEVAY